ncbi:MAG: endonuclease/exonuclease/phosphatase family protein [Chlamydiae bacterium]|nr:endonuclease/exonuclease/phosphatase family protein [Chlamydiota bacterium]
MYSIEISDTIVPLIERVEKAENLNPTKYSKNQYEHIVHVLSNIEDRIRLVTYNMLYNIQDQNLEEQDRWPRRFPRLLQLIQWLQPDILCSQELHQDQLSILLHEMDETYAFYGKENKNNGEIDGIFIRKARFELIDFKEWMIFPTLPLAYPHVLIQLVLCDNKTQEIFSVFNTHLPYFSPDQREYSAHFILKQVEAVSQRMPVFLAGDFNVIPQRQDMPELPFFDGEYIQRILTQGTLKDTMDEALLGHIGPIATFTNALERNDGTPFKGTGVPGIILDRIYSNQKSLILVHGIEPARVDNHFPSDHMPVIVDFLIRDKKE